MKKNRCFKLTALLLAMIMMISIIPSFAFGAEGQVGPIDEVLESAELDSTFVESAIILDANKKEVKDLSIVDPNGSFTLNLKVKQPDFPASGEEKLPDDTNQVVMFYHMENMKAESGENDYVSWKYDAKTKDLVFDWKQGKRTSFEANIQIAPDYDETLGLDGKSFAIVANNNVLLSGVKSNTALKAVVATQDSEGKLLYESPEDAYWTFTRYSGNWYTISRNGQYLHIVSNGLTLTDAESAQKIKVEDKGGYYLLCVNNRSLSCVKATDGFISVGVGTTIADKQKVKLYSEISNEQTNGLPETGDYIIANTKPQWKNLLLDRAGQRLGEYPNSLGAAQFTLDGDSVVPRGEYVFWHFEHITRDWYYISNGNGKYLKVISKGAELTSEKTPILVKRKGTENNYCFTCEGLTNVWLNNKADNATAGFWYTTKDQYKWLQLYSSVKETETIIPAGELMITFPNTKALMLTESTSNGFKSVAYTESQEAEGGIVLPDNLEAPLWTFEKVNGNYYYIGTNGKYLNLSQSGATLTDQPQKLYIQQQGDRYRISDGISYELRNKDTNAKNGFISYYDHDNNGTWLALIPQNHEEDNLEDELEDDPENNLVFDLNGGGGAASPRIGSVQPGETITLPNYTGTKNNSRFIGWAEVSNIYVNPEGKNHCYQEVYLPGSSFTVPEEKIILYAVYNEKGTKARFGFRIDGTIPDEPSNYPVEDYTGHFEIANAIKDGKWVVDVQTDKSIKGNHLDNDVVANLNVIPSDEIIKEHMPDYDPATQYVHWYVLKYSGGKWKIDGVIRNRNVNSIAYDTNINRADLDTVENMPRGHQSGEDEEIVVPNNPSREGYEFLGWSTSADGEVEYTAGDRIKLDGNITLFAQWDDTLTVVIHSNVENLEKVYSGTEIVLTAERGGTYTGNVNIQWRQVDPETGEGTIIPDANEMTYSFKINKDNAKYIYQVILTPVD